MQIYQTQHNLIFAPNNYTSVTYVNQFTQKLISIVHYNLIQQHTLSIHVIQFHWPSSNTIYYINRAIAWTCFISPFLFLSLSLKPFHPLHISLIQQWRATTKPKDLAQPKRASREATKLVSNSLLVVLLDTLRLASMLSVSVLLLPCISPLFLNILLLR